ncbi:iron-regulated transcriptional activator Aft2p [Monosporozyma unispora]
MVKKPRSIWSPDHLTDALHREQNKLIHLDPVPIFKKRGDIKPWLQKIFFPQVIDLVIERSDSGKVIFKCKSNIRHEYKKRNSKDKEENKDNEPKFCCPFRIRATFSLKLQKWNIVVVNNVHSHELEFNPTSDEYKKFKKLLVANNDLETIKNFEELEYKTKLKLPILPQVMTCDCGLTNEINWFDVVLPEPRISTCKTTKRINKKKKSQQSQSHLSRNNVIPMVSDSLSSFFKETQEQINTTIQNVKQEEQFALPQTPMVNLDEIDFTDMFKTPKNNSSSINNSTSLKFVKKDKESPKHFLQHSSSTSSLSSTTLLETQPAMDIAEDSLSYNNLASPLHLTEEMSTDLLMMKTTAIINIHTPSMTQMDMNMDAMTTTESVGQVCEDPEEEESAVFKESAWIGLCPGLKLQQESDNEINETTLQPISEDRVTDDADNKEQLNSYLDFLNIANCSI